MLERLTQQLEGILDYTYPKARHLGLMKKRLRRGRLCCYLWRPPKTGAMGASLSVGLQGPQDSAFRSISLSEPMQHDRSMSIITSFAAERIGWNAADSGIGSLHT